MQENKERELTEAEQRRKERFEALSARLQGEGYVPRALTIDAVKANFLALFIMLPFAAVFLVWYLWRNGGVAALSLSDLLLVLAIMMALLALHELIHGLVWSRFVPGRFRSIEFGVVWKALSPYCTCAEPMQKWQYCLGSVMPTVVLGFGLGAAAVLLGNTALLYLSLLMIFGGGGDFCILFRLLGYRPAGEAIYCDHPYELGLVVFERNARDGAA